MKLINAYAAFTFVFFAGIFSINKLKTSPEYLIKPGFHEFNPKNFSLEIKRNRNQVREILEENEIPNFFTVKTITSDSLSCNNESSIRYLFNRTIV